MNFQIHFDIPFYAFLLFGALSAGLSYLMYRKLEGISRPRQTFLGVLRAVSFFLLFLAMANLVTDFIRFESKKRDIFLLVDDSKSMSLKDGPVSRPDIVKAILGSASFRDLQKYFQITPVVFGGSVLHAIPLDSLRFDQPATNIESAVSQVSKRSSNGRAAFALLLSDGDYNEGGNPIDAVRDLPFPVYTIGIGDSTVPRDVIVKRVIPAPAVYAGKKSVVKAIIGSNGFGGALVTAHLLEDGREVDAKSVTLPQTGDVEVSFDYIPTTVGTHLLRVYIPPLNGEFNRRNNSATVTAQVQKGKYSVLLVAGEPATDVAFLRRNLEGSGDFDLKVLIQKTGGSFYENDAAATLSGKYDAVVLYDFPNKESEGTLGDVMRMLNETGVPYAYFAGAEFSAQKVSELSRLPFAVTGYEPGEVQVGVSLVNNGTLPIMVQLVYTLIEANSALFPPLYYNQIQCRPSPGSVALASPVINGARVGVPLFLLDPAAHTAAFLAYGIWRLELMSPLSGLRKDFLQDFLTALVRTLISGGKQRLLTVHTDKNVYDPSEPVNFNALLVGQSGSPVDGAAVDVSIRNTNSRTASHIRLSSTGEGGYEGSASGLGEGKYTFEARAALGTTFLGADSGTVVVEPLNTEFVQTAMNASLLRQIASVSGGQFMTPSRFEKEGIDVGPALKEPLKLADKRRFELLTFLPILGLVLFLLAAEWTIRKIWGLP